jgi:hypothetical protein
MELEPISLDESRRLIALELIVAKKGRIAYQLIETGAGQTEVWRKGMIVSDRRRLTNKPQPMFRD